MVIKSLQVRLSGVWHLDAQTPKPAVCGGRIPAGPQPGVWVLSSQCGAADGAEEWGGWGRLFVSVCFQRPWELLFSFLCLITASAISIKEIYIRIYIPVLEHHTRKLKKLLKNV